MSIGEAKSAELILPLSSLDPGGIVTVWKSRRRIATTATFRPVPCEEPRICQHMRPEKNPIGTKTSVSV